jgi:uncharacterized protein YggU (UPF0235/DUF167 family)
LSSCSPWTDHPEGVVLGVRAQPGASRAGLRGEQNLALKVAVTRIAEKGQANQALVEVLAVCLALKRSQFELLAGQTTRDKASTYPRNNGRGIGAADYSCFGAIVIRPFLTGSSFTPR